MRLRAGRGMRKASSGPSWVPQAPRCQSDSRQGVVLIAVLIVLVILTLGAYQFSLLMTAEYEAAQSYAQSVQAKALADSGVQYAAALLSNLDSFTNLLAGNPYDNPQAFGAILVNPSEVPRFQGRFSIIAGRSPEEGTGFRFGVSDECAKLNLSALLRLDSSGQVAQNALMALPNMTEEVANAILDWIDPDEDPRPGGAESDVYAGMSPPYRAKNGPLDSLDELLLVRGVTWQLLFGNDRNRNGLLDPDEDDGSGVLDRGWSAFLTVHSRERNLDAANQPRININDSDLNALYDKLNQALGQDLAEYIIAARLYGLSTQQSGQGGNQSSGSGGTTSAAASVPLSSQNRSAITSQLQNSRANANRQQLRAISSLFDLVNSSVAVPMPSGTGGNTGTSQTGPGMAMRQQGTGNQSTTVTFPSPLNDLGTQRQLLPILLDRVTTVRDAELPARVNVNTAPREVLLALPGLTESDVQAIMDYRPSASATEVETIYQTPAWLMTEANIRPETLRTLERYITARSQVYRVQAVGHFDGGGPTARVEAIIDINAGRPRIVYYRDLTELGKGFDLRLNVQ